MSSFEKACTHHCQLSYLAHSWAWCLLIPPGGFPRVFVFKSLSNADARSVGIGPDIIRKLSRAGSKNDPGPKDWWLISKQLHTLGPFCKTSPTLHPGLAQVILDKDFNRHGPNHLSEEARSINEAFWDNSFLPQWAKERVLESSHLSMLNAGKRQST